MGFGSDGREDVCSERKTDGQINLMHEKNAIVPLRLVEKEKWDFSD